VAAAGNNGRETLVYPAAYQSMVTGVASTSNNDTLSSFSNYGPDLVWVAAPGEGVITLYPFGSYAATWGTSFSAPFVSGTAALLLSVQPYITESQAAEALAQAQYISSATGKGRLDVYRAVLFSQQFK
jgi:subtilisin family serine protease